MREGGLGWGQVPWEVRVVTWAERKMEGEECEAGESWSWRSPHCQRCEL